MPISLMDHPCTPYMYLIHGAGFVAFLRAYQRHGQYNTAITTTNTA